MVECARAPLGKDGGLGTATPVLDRVGRFEDFVEGGAGRGRFREWLALRAAETIGRRLGDAAFPDRIEGVLGCPLLPGRARPKAKPRRRRRFGSRPRCRATEDSVISRCKKTPTKANRAGYFQAS